MMLHRHFEAERKNEKITKLADLNGEEKSEPKEEQPKRGRKKKTEE